jgi:biotin carboxyl carrier protein
VVGRAVRATVRGFDAVTLQVLDETVVESRVPSPIISELVGSQEDRTLGIVRLEVVVDGWRFEVAVEDAARAALRQRASRASQGPATSGSVRIEAQIPGRVVSVDVSVGDEVEAGQRLLSVEAMKMENEIRAPRSGRVTSVAVAVDDLIELRSLLVVLE